MRRCCGAGSANSPISPRPKNCIDAITARYSASPPRPRHHHRHSRRATALRPHRDGAHRAPRPSLELARAANRSRLYSKCGVVTPTFTNAPGGAVRIPAVECRPQLLTDKKTQRPREGASNPGPWPPRLYCRSGRGGTGSAPAVLRGFLLLGLPFHRTYRPIRLGRLRSVGQSKLLRTLAREFVEAPALHRGIEHLQGAAAGIDLIVMGEIRKTLEDAEQLLVPGCAPDLHVAGAALRAERPEPRELVSAEKPAVGPASSAITSRPVFCTE